MSFPQSVLDTRVELLLGGTWTNITSKIYFRDGVTITGGHPDEASRANPTVAALTVNNQTGDFAPRNPLGAYYGLIGRNTPLRISVPEGSTYLRSETDTTSGITCPSSAGLNITGDLEVQVDAALDDWYANGGGNIILAAKYNTTGNQRSWLLGLLAGSGNPYFVWSVDGTNTNAHQAVSSAPVTPTAPNRRLAIKATFAAASGTVTFYTAPTISGTWTQFGSPIVLGSATSIFSSTAAVSVGYNNAGIGFQGKIFACKVLSGIAGTLKASPDFTAQTDGATSFNDAQGNTWTVNGTAEISGRKYRCHGEVPAWPQKWDKTQRDIYAPIQASGLLRRLGLPTAAVLNSALYRAYVRATGSSVPAAYWPCEEGANSTSIASGLTGGRPMVLTGTPTFASNTAFLCSAALPVLAGSVWTGQVPQTTAAVTSNTVNLLLSVPGSGETNGAVLARILTTGTIARVDLSYGTGGVLTVTGYNTGGAQLFTSNSSGSQSVNGNPMIVQISQATNGSGVDFNALFFTLANYEAIIGQLTQASSTIGQITQVIVNPGGIGTSSAIGHVAALQSNVSITSYPITAYAGENAATRFTRLCKEEGVASRIWGNPSDTMPMGAQTPKKLLDLLQECEDADAGLIYEPRHVMALGLRTRVSLYNQSPALALDYSQQQLANELVPVDDDLLTLNDVTVQRSNGGSSARQVLTSGTLSNQAPPNGVGPYPTAPSINLQSDSQLADQAGWLLHVGTVDEPRYPGISVDLARPQVAGVYYTAQDVRIGDRITVANTPSFLPPDGISQIVRGFSETCYGYDFKLTWLCSPESPFRVAILDDWVLARADTDGSTLASSITSTQTTSVQLATTNTNSPVWTTNLADFPFDVSIGGERITVAAPGTLLTGNPFFTTGISGWAGQNGTLAWSQDFLFPTNSDGVLRPYATGVAKVTPNGTSASGGAFTTGFTGVGTITPTASYICYGWFYSPAGWSDLRPVIDFYDSSGTFLSTGLGSATSVPAGTWTFISQTLTAPANASQAELRMRFGGTPSSSNVYYVFGAGLVPAASISTSSPQPYTVIRSVNGVVKAQSAGADVRLFQPMILGL